MAKLAVVVKVISDDWGTNWSETHDEGSRVVMGLLETIYSLVNLRVRPLFVRPLVRIIVKMF